MDDREYHKQKSKEHYQKYRQAYLDRSQQRKSVLRSLLIEAKKGGCINCPEKEPCALDFHHVRDKEFEVSLMRGRNEKKILEEIDKCVVLCANCHRKVHANLISIGGKV